MGARRYPVPPREDNPPISEAQQALAFERLLRARSKVSEQGYIDLRRASSLQLAAVFALQLGLDDAKLNRKYEISVLVVAERINVKEWSNGNTEGSSDQLRVIRASYDAGYQIGHIVRDTPFLYHPIGEE